MAKNKFYESEKIALVQFHKLELISALKKVEHIKERIHVLTGRKKTVRRTKAQLAAARKPTRVRRTKAQMTAAAKPLRSHHKKATTTRATKTQSVKWKTFVPDLLKQKGAPMTTREILNIAVKKFNISAERKKMKSLSQILRNMKKAGHITAEEIKGSKIKQYSLVS